MDNSTLNKRPAKKVFWTSLWGMWLRLRLASVVFTAVVVDSMVAIVKMVVEVPLVVMVVTVSAPIISPPVVFVPGLLPPSRCRGGRLEDQCRQCQPWSTLDRTKNCFHILSWLARHDRIHLLIHLQRQVSQWGFEVRRLHNLRICFKPCVFSERYVGNRTRVKSSSGQHKRN